MIPDHIVPTQYPNYYVTRMGDCYRNARPKGERMPVNEYGLVYLKPGFQGHNKYKEKQYHCVNISLYDENNNFVKQFTRPVHRLVAETFIPNPDGHNEILHGKRGHLCNSVDNLRWGTHQENMMEADSALPEGTIRNYKGSSSKYIKKNDEWVLIPNTDPVWNKGKRYGAPDGTVKKLNNGHYKVKENGVWVHMKQKDYSKYGV